MHRLERRARLNGGYVTRADVERCGVWESELRRAVKEGQWTIIRRGVYAPRESYDSLNAHERHLLLVRSCVAEAGPGYVVTHASAILAHRLGAYRHGTYELDLDVAHLAHLDGTTSRRTASVQYHRRAIDTPVVTVAGVPCLDALTAVVVTMTTVGLDAAAVLASTWLARRRAEAADHGMLAEFDQEAARKTLREACAYVRGWRGSRTARDACEIADAGCESVGEVRFLVLCWEYGLPRPTTQLPVALDDGRFAEVDFAFRAEGLVVEFDGMLKYEDQPGGRTAKAVVRAEKKREKELRDQRWHVIRVTWADLAPAKRAGTAAYVRRELNRAARHSASRRQR